MQILPSGQVQITNNQTGETRVVDPSQLSSFSPLLANQYYNAMAESRANNKATGAGSSSPENDILQPPSGTMPTMPTTQNQNAPMLSGNDLLNKSGIKPGKGAKQNASHAPLNFVPNYDTTNLTQTGQTQGNQLAQQPQTNTPWIGSQIAGAVGNYFKVPQLQPKSLSQLGL